jgi:excisionase family DNA binding protein
MVETNSSANNQILTVEEVAAYLKVSSRSIYALLAKEEIPAFRVGGAWRFRRDELDYWTRQGEVTSNRIEGEIDSSNIDAKVQKLVYEIENSNIIENQSRIEIAKTFFEDPKTVQNRTVQGVVETPLQVAKFIVRLALDRWQSSNSKPIETFFEIDWFDPCTGSGVFAEAILELGFDLKAILKESELPKITVGEISPIGISATLKIIKALLDRHQLSLTNYYNSGRLKVKLGDTLNAFPEKRDIFNSNNELFDIVVGNPPYVRATNIKLNYKLYLKKIFPNIYSGDADLYTYFIASGILSLKPKGVLAFISPAGFIRSKNSHRLRKWLTTNSSLDSFYDLDETSVFPDAELHSAIFTLRKDTNQQSEISYKHVSDNNQLSDLFNNLYGSEVAIIEQPKGHGWIFHKSIADKNTFVGLFEKCKPLNEFGITVYSGIRPGLSEAFILDYKKYNDFSDDIKSKWFKPLVLPSDIIRWKGNKDIHYLLTIPSDTLDIDQELLDYLQPFKIKLLQRSEVSNGLSWFNLRPCNYYSKMEKPKIVFPDLSAQQRFAVNTEGVYVPDGAYFMDSADLALLGILNSELARIYFVNRCSSVGNLNSKGRFRFKKTFVQNFPLPENYTPNGTIQNEIKSNVEQILASGESIKFTKNINELVHELYSSNL